MENSNPFHFWLLTGVLTNACFLLKLKIPCQCPISHCWHRLKSGINKENSNYSLVILCMNSRWILDNDYHILSSWYIMIFSVIHQYSYQNSSIFSLFQYSCEWVHYNWCKAISQGASYFCWDSSTARRERALINQSVKWFIECVNDRVLK